MAIKFLRDHRVDGPPVEEFKGGQVVKNRNDASELHFVRRGHAAYLDEKSGKLTDHEGNSVNDPFAKDAAPADDGDGLDKLSGAKLKAIVTKEKVEGVADDASDDVIRTAIRAHRQAGEPAADGLDDLTDAELVERITLGEIAVEPGADRATMLAALREAARHAANGQ
jgi:hypothetical protein